MKLLDCTYNPEVEMILNDIQKLVYRNTDTIFAHGKKDENDFYTEEKYLSIMLDKDERKEHEGYPEVTYGTSLVTRKMISYDNQEFKYNMSEELYDNCVNQMSDLCKYLGARNNAVMMYYPENGFMGWHHNANAAGYNILLSYSLDGDGFFRYRDPITHEIVTIPDKEGWTIKVGYYGSFEETDKVYWHCARTKKPRLTLGFIVPDESMWQMMIEDICDYDQ
jgi:hypothetical protein